MVQLFGFTYNKFIDNRNKQKYTDRKSRIAYFSQNPINNMNSRILWDSIHKY